MTNFFHRQRILRTTNEIVDMLEVFEDTEDIEEDYDDDVADQDYVCTGNSDTSDDEEMLTKV